MRVTINHANISRFGSLPGVDRDMLQRAQKVAKVARAAAPVDTGAYKGSIHVTDTDDDAGYRVIADVDHAVYVEWDTDPHTIRPRSAQALWWPGAAHPVAKVEHPGTTGQHVMGGALDAATGHTHT